VTYQTKNIFNRKIIGEKDNVLNHFVRHIFPHGMQHFNVTPRAGHCMEKNNKSAQATGPCTEATVVVSTFLSQFQVLQLL
jgi:predicted secreted Zn-dependent protease